MVATPFFGPMSVTRSTNVADNQLVNLRPELVDTKDGKNVGALYGTPGLDLLATVGAGPINGTRTLAGATLYVVSGSDVYTVNTSYAATLIGTIAGSGGRVSLMDNGAQMTIFTDQAAYAGPIGFPFTGGNIATAGINYIGGDTIVLQVAATGKQTAAAIIEVTGVTGGGGITGFTILQTGAFSPAPATLVQQNTTGSGSGFVLDTVTVGPTQELCQIDLPFTPQAQMSATFQDDFGLVTDPLTMRIWQSQVLDISVWPALNFAFANGESDFVVALYSIHREVFVIKAKSTEVWNDAGTTGFAFQPLGAVMIEHGTTSWGTVTKVGDSLLFLSRSGQGQGTVIEVDGFAPRRVSTHAIETMIAAAPTLMDAWSYSYLQEGHQLYVLTLPSGNLTVVYDQTATRMAGVPIWYGPWGYFSAGHVGRHRGNAYAFFNETPVLGDYQNGNLYRINLNTLTDNGQPIQRVRSWRALAKPTMEPTAFASLQIDLQTGIGYVTTSPQIVLDWSDDGGHNWSNQRIMSAGQGQVGQTAWRVRSNRLGSTKRNAGLDRIFRITTTDQFPICFIGAEIDV